MATLRANYSFDMDAVDLSEYYWDAYYILFYDNYYFDVNGTTHQDSLDIYRTSHGASLWTEFYGNNIRLDEFSGEVYGGTVSAIFENIWDGFNYQPWWSIEGVSISAVALQNAMYTSSSSDDFGILAAALAGADRFHLSSYADVARGYGGNDTIYGNGGNDRLFGGTGNDRLDGGAGTDRLEGGVGNDTYILATSGDTVIEAGGEGVDTVQAGYSYTLAAGVENLLLTGTAAINGTGNALANTIVGNRAANVLNGGSGSDRLQGGLGNDIYVLATSGDTVVEASGGGVDTVQAGYSHTLSANLENLVLTGTAAINGTGNALANRLTGNGANNALFGSDGADVLLGGAGSDRLAGGSGTDTLNGGTGNDSFQFTRLSERADVVTDFSNIAGNNDQFLINVAGFGGGLTADRYLAASQFQTRTDNLAQDADDRFVFRTTDRTLWFDADGRGGVAAVLVADLQQTATLTSADILLI